MFSNTFILALFMFLALAMASVAQTNTPTSGAQSQQQNEDDEDDDDEELPAAPVAPQENATITVNGDAFTIANGQALALKRNYRYDVVITGLRPYTTITVEMYKAGTKLGERKFQVNQRGEFMFEYTTPGNRVRGEARLKYQASGGQMYDLQVPVSLE